MLKGRGPHQRGRGLFQKGGDAAGVCDLKGAWPMFKEASPVLKGAWPSSGEGPK